MVEAPFFSIVIPTYNRPAQLAACLQACARLDYPRDRFEVIAVDDGGSHPLDALFADTGAVPSLTLLRQENTGPAGARNKGASAAKGAFLAFTDDDCLPAPEWLRSLAARFALAPDCAVGGRTVNALNHNRYSTASQLLISYLFSYYNAAPQAARFFPANNLAFPAGMFRAIKGFDVTYPRAAAEDRELCDRWLYCGYRMVYAPEAVVYHAHDLTLRKFLSQHFNYGRGAFCYHKLRARRAQHGIELEPVTFYFNLLRYSYRNARGIEALTLMLLLAMTQVANAAGLFWERFRERVLRQTYEAPAS